MTPRREPALAIVEELSWIHPPNYAVSVLQAACDGARRAIQAALTAASEAERLWISAACKAPANEGRLERAQFLGLVSDPDSTGDGLVSRLLRSAGPVRPEALAALLATGSELEAETLEQTLISRLRTEPAAPIVAIRSAFSLFGGEEAVDLSAYHKQSFQALHAEVCRAQDLILRANVNAHEMMSRFLSAVALRIEQGDGHPSSSSWRVAPGLAAITNLHLAEHPTLFAANALVHESVHALLYCAEIKQDVVLPCASSDVRVRSPWTGASLRANGFVHACFVWFALSMFWRDALDSGGADTTAAASFLARAQSGFRHTPTNLVATTCPDIDSHVLQAIQEMEQLVRRL